MSPAFLTVLLSSKWAFSTRYSTYCFRLKVEILKDIVVVLVYLVIVQIQFIVPIVRAAPDECKLNILSLS
jgi:hypothetical protein